MQAGEKTVVLASADANLRQRLVVTLQRMRWQVKEVTGGAAAMAHLEEFRPEALLLDSWLPDLEAGELAGVVQQLYPELELFRLDGSAIVSKGKHPWSRELLHALREIKAAGVEAVGDRGISPDLTEAGVLSGSDPQSPLVTRNGASPACVDGSETAPVSYLPGLIGASVPMRELGRLIRLVAPHPARVLIEGETGSGKELVARAVHALSGRSSRPFVALNCAAIPETLLEAELFGHTRGAFTGAVQARVGRIEAADGGTLFLDEIGELPLSLQAKLLRFLENGELQKIGGNDAVVVDVRIVSATHQLLEERAEAGTFRLDLYHRLATFPVQVPALRERLEDLPMLTTYLLSELGRAHPQKHLGKSGLDRLQQHSWPGNVRELQNVLQRAVILADTRSELVSEDILFGRIRRN